MNDEKPDLQIEALKHQIGPERLGYIGSEIERLFEEWAERNLQGARDEMEKVYQELGWGSPQQTEAAIQKRREEYASFDFGRKVSKLSNNFYWWWPGGNHREKLESKIAAGETSDEIEAQKRNIAVLDEAISEARLGEYNQIVAEKAPSDSVREVKMLVVADICLRMLEKGYPPDLGGMIK